MVKWYDGSDRVSAKWKPNFIKQRPIWNLSNISTIPFEPNVRTRQRKRETAKISSWYFWTHFISHSLLGCAKGALAWTRKMIQSISKLSHVGGWPEWCERNLVCFPDISCTVVSQKSDSPLFALCLYKFMTSQHHIIQVEERRTTAAEKRDTDRVLKTLRQIKTL